VNKEVKDKKIINDTFDDENHHLTFGKDLLPYQRKLYVIAGSISLGIGAAGIILPLVPTTPLLLLSAYCYAKSSKRFYFWLITNKYFGEYLKNYREKKGVPLKIKIYTLLLLWLTISFSAFYVVNILWLRILLMIIAISVSIHVLSIKTFKKTPKKHL